MLSRKLIRTLSSSVAVNVGRGQADLVRDVFVRGSTVHIQWMDGQKGVFHGIWLRDHCQCARCRNQQTCQRTVDTFKIPLDVAPASATLERSQTGDDPEIIVLDWGNDLDGQACSLSRFESSWLKRFNYSHQAHRSHLKVDGDFERVLWDASSTLPQSFYYQDVISSDEAVRNVKAVLRDYGIAFIHSVPCADQAIMDLATKIDNIKSTLYEDLWSTIVQADMKTNADTAYTNEGLQPHTDLTYFDHPARFQVFNCTQRAPKGGENIFVDAFNAVNKLRQKDPEAFEFLSTVSIPFHFTEPGKHHYVSVQPVIQVDSFGNVTRVKYNEYDREVLSFLDYSKMGKFYEYMRAFSSIIRSGDMNLEYTLDKNEMVIVDNFRVFHGRKPFEGSRTLKGCYLDGEGWLSRLRTM